MTSTIDELRRQLRHASVLLATSNSEQQIGRLRRARQSIARVLADVDQLVREAEIKEDS